VRNPAEVAEMKILHVIAAVHRQGGGTSEVVPRICLAQKNAGYEVSLMALKTSDISSQTELAIRSGVDVAFVDGMVRCPVIRSIGYAPKFYGMVEEAISRSDIVQLHGLWMYPVWAAAKAARKLKKPYVVMPHGFLAPERLKISRLKKLLAAKLFDHKMLSCAKAIIATSEREAQDIRAFGIDNPICIIPLGLDAAAFDASSRVVKGKKKTLLYFSRFTPIKGLDMLAEAWSMLWPLFPDWKLRMVGPDDRGYVRKVKQMFSAKCDAGSYVIEGPVFDEEKLNVLKSADVFVLPTRSENWSLAVAEAMASGLPVVCTKGAPWSCLNEINAGVWVDVSVDGIYKGLAKIMSASDEDRIIMGTRGRKWVTENLDWKIIATKFVTQYAQQKENHVRI
jgi:glycosyltransferase involved in cell wall biosynthesis